MHVLTTNLRRRLSFEPLEDRRLLAVLTVNTLLDGISPNDGLVTLREAIAAANADSITDLEQTGSGADTIVFDAALDGTVELATAGDFSNGPTALLVTSAITIRGNQNGITIGRAAGAGEMRLFRNTASGSLTFETIMLTSGLARGEAGAAGQNGSQGRGGAIYNEGTLRIFDSTLFSNQAIGGNGGSGGVGAPGRGGAVYNVGGDVAIRNSTFSGNSALVGTGGSPPPSYGGGIYTVEGSVSIHNSTFVNNVAVSGRSIYVFADGADAQASLVMVSTIVGNFGVTGVDPDLAAISDNDGTVVSSGGFNIIRRANGFDGTWEQTNDIFLEPLADNGGPTLTHELMEGSIAIDAGSNSLSLLTDQRGATFSRVVGNGPDVGAFERQTTLVPSLLGDYTRDQIIDAADYVVWRHTTGAQNLEAYSGADGSGDGQIDDFDYNVWHDHFGASDFGGGAGSQSENGLYFHAAGVVVGRAGAISIAARMDLPSQTFARSLRQMNDLALLAILSQWGGMNSDSNTSSIDEPNTPDDLEGEAVGSASDQYWAIFGADG